MTIDRIGTNAGAQLLLAQLQKAEAALNDSNRQVASGKVADTYTGYGIKTAPLEAARSVVARIDADLAVAKQALGRLDLQDSQLTQLGTIAGNLRQTLTTAVGNNDATALMSQVQGYFEQAVALLNARDGGGYIYGGDKQDVPPVSVSSLADLAALPSVSAAFANGTVERTVRIGEDQTIKTGVLASTIATELFTLFRDIAQFDQGVSGPLDQQLDGAKRTFLEGAIPDAIAAAQKLNTHAAENGYRYGIVRDAIEGLNVSSVVYKTFTANIEEVDMAEALTRLNQNQIALQAALHVSSQLNQLSLLDYLG